MTPRRIAIAIALLGWAHNALRVAASLLGFAGNNFFNYLPPYRSNPGPTTFPYYQIAGLVFATALGAFAMWYDSERPPSERSDSFWSSALWSAVTSVVAGLLVVWVSTTVERTYGWWLFVMLPVLTGFEATVLLGRRREVTAADAVGVSSMAVLLLGMALMLFAFEGLICMVMAAPLAFPLAMLGGILAWMLVPRRAGYHSVSILLLAG